MSARRCSHRLTGPALDGLLWCQECDAEVIRGYVVADTLDVPEDTPKIPWNVKVDKLGENSFRTMFQVGVQSFELARAEDDDEGEQHCNFIAKCFREAMSRAGCPRERT